MRWMNLFEPLFLLLVLVAIVTLLTIAVFAARGQMARAGRIVRRLGIGAAVYFAVVITVSLVSARREYRIGDTQCFDDWCIPPTHPQPTSSAPATQLKLSPH